MNLSGIKSNFQKGALTKPQYIEEMHAQHTRLFEYARFIRDTDIAVIEIMPDQIVMTFKTSGIKMLCDEIDRRIAPIEALNFGSYEKTEADIVIKLIEPRYRLFDIGANVGWYSLHIAKAYRDVIIYAFEPVPATFNYLKKNVELNGANNISVYNFGFSNHSSDVVFYVYPGGCGNASVANVSGNENVEEIKCTVKRLDEFVEQNKTGVDFIKCDVEGAELFVYEGGINALKKYKPVVFTEMLRKWSAKFDYHPNEIIALLSGIGYKCYVARGGKLNELPAMDDNTEETNFFFLHTEKHAQKIAALGTSL